jgi:hypothetical protein
MTVVGFSKSKSSEGIEKQRCGIDHAFSLTPAPSRWERGEAFTVALEMHASWFYHPSPFVPLPVEGRGNSGDASPCMLVPLQIQLADIAKISTQLN